MASSVCRRCRLPFQDTGARTGDERDCLDCALIAARVPLGPQHLECRWYRDGHGQLQRKWTRVGTQPAAVRAHATDDAAMGESARRVATAEMWMKVMVHVAGFAALIAAPAVATLLTHLSDQLRLLP
jgi:hypothetical protein